MILHKIYNFNDSFWVKLFQRMGDYVMKKMKLISVSLYMENDYDNLLLQVLSVMCYGKLSCGEEMGLSE